MKYFLLFLFLMNNILTAQSSLIELTYEYSTKHKIIVAHNASHWDSLAAN